jgi:hypothetical protein
MELELLTQIQDKISTNRKRRERTLRKFKNGNSAAARTLHRVETSSNSGENRLVVSNVVRSTQPKETPEEICKRIFSESGWVIRSHFNDPTFRVENLNRKLVAFTVRNEADELQKYSGILQAFSKTGSALFRLAGQEGVFNANLIGFMATQPA